MSITERFARTQFIFTAVLKVEQNICTTDSTRSNFKYYYDDVVYTIFTVTKVWKGQLPREIAIVQPPSSCSYDFADFNSNPYYQNRDGSPLEFVIFASEWNENAYFKLIPKHSFVLTTNQCQGNCIRTGQVTRTLDSLSGLANIIPTIAAVIPANPELVIQIAVPYLNKSQVELRDGITMQIIPTRWRWETQAILEVRVKYEYLRNRLFTLRIQRENGIYFYPFMYQEPYTYFPAKPRYYVH